MGLILGTRRLSYSLLMDGYLAASCGPAEPDIIEMPPKLYAAVTEELRDWYRERGMIPIRGEKGWLFCSAQIIYDPKLPDGTIRFVHSSRPALSLTIKNVTCGEETRENEE